MEPDFHLAPAHAYSGRRDQALAGLRRVIALEPESTYAERARNVMPQIEKMAVPEQGGAEPRLSGSLQLAAEFDSNVLGRS